jgi:hypothetical protein
MMWAMADAADDRYQRLLDAARTRFTAAGATKRWLGHAHELSLDARATYLLVEALLASILVPVQLGSEVGDEYADDQRASHAAPPPNDDAASTSVQDQCRIRY